MPQRCAAKEGPVAYDLNGVGNIYLSKRSATRKSLLANRLDGRRQLDPFQSRTPLKKVPRYYRNGFANHN